jgi:hypothetical protein
MKQVLLFFILVCGFFGFSQEEPLPEPTPESESVDDRYREDQFYLAVTYNLLTNKPKSVSQQGFSSGFHLGFIRDMPFNTSRTWSAGLGLGLSANTYNQNLRVSKDANTTNFTVINDTETAFTKNKYFTYVVEVPLELRWRNSTASSYKFWRVYSGFKFGYIFANQTKYVGDPSSVKLSGVDNFNKLQYGLSIGAGYNTWNFHFYYGLNSLFNSDSKLSDGSEISMRAAKIGLIFYIF